MARVTLVSRNFPPLTGGMERLVHCLYEGLQNQHQVRLLGPAGCGDFVAHDAEVSATRTSPTSLFLLLTFIKGLFGWRFGGRPEIVIGGSGLMSPVVLLLAFFARARSVLLLHGLDIVADSRFYQWLFVPLLKRADFLICNSSNTAALAQIAGVPARKTTIINPGADIASTVVSHNTAKQALDLQDKTVLLSVGRLIPRKGLAEFIDNCFAKLAASRPDLILLIAGTEPDSALNKPATSVQQRIAAAIETHGLQHQVRMLGHVADDALTRIYAAADAFVFPLVATHGDVEGFGMVAVEAAAHCTPTVAFDCGGVSDAVAEGVSGYLIEEGDYAAFAEAVIEAVSGELRDSARNFALQFSWDNYQAKIEQQLHRVLA